MTPLHFPKDDDPVHIDATFVALNDHMVLTNPERPPVDDEMKIFKENDWRLLEAPKYATDLGIFDETPWLSMNVLSVGPNKIVVEENEKPMIQFLEQEHGFDVLTVPFRSVYEFGGSLHCTTWDVRRRGDRKNYFPNR